VDSDSETKVLKKAKTGEQTGLKGERGRRRDSDKSKLSSNQLSKKARLIHRRASKGGERGYELVRESKLIWEHLRQHDNVPSRTLALDEMMALAKGHFREVRWEWLEVGRVSSLYIGWCRAV